MDMVSTKCALIGEGPILIACAKRLKEKGYGIQGVISDCDKVRAWCGQSGIPLLNTKDDTLEFLSRNAFDFLFSIVNHKVLAPELLALPRRAAINYHDSPLPDYAGFNATAWAILDDRQSHGVTWHRMTANVDEGNILVSETISILEDDTAFTLSTKCADAALRSFDTLLERLSADDLDGKAQGPNTNFHLKSARPGAAFLNFHSPARIVARTVRGLDFGPDESWLTTAKFRTPSGEILRAGSASAANETGASPGSIIRVSADRVQVATIDGSVELSEITSLDGEPQSEIALAALGVSQGAMLTLPEQAALEILNEFDATVTRSERFWCERLQRFLPTKLSEISIHEQQASRADVFETAPQWLASMPQETRGAALLAAVGLYLSRVGEGTDQVYLAYHSGELTEDQKRIYSELTPLQLSVDRNASFQTLLGAATAELDESTKRQTFSRDVKIRYPRLRELPAFAQRVSIAVTAALESSLPNGCSLCFGLDESGGQIHVAFDAHALSVDTARALGQRIARILEQCGENQGAALRDISSLTQAEGKLLLETWQDTKVEYASDKCIHQLFEAQVQRTPNDIALVFQSESLTYAQLDAQANAVAQNLVEHGVSADDLVGVCVARSLNMMVALLGVLKAGAAYVPLDPAYPLERISIMLQDSQARVLITTGDLENKLPAHSAQVLLIENVGAQSAALADVKVRPENLAYVIFTSGSTGRPKGVMVEHRNVSNFFTGMDATIGAERGTWLAVTSISFDISVLELFWTLTRGFKVVIQAEGDRASLRRASSVQASSKPMDFGFFYFAAKSGGADRETYRLLLEGAKFADQHDFSSVWTPERHFHEFGGIYPNPAVTTAALAAITKRIGLRAGSVVLPLHNPIRVAEDWAVVDILSEGRIGLSFASGWHANDFALMPDNFENRRAIMQESIATVRKLWRGEKIPVKNGSGQEIEVGAFPRPIQENPPIWIATAGTPDTFRIAGKNGFNILTNMLGQDIKVLRENFAAYREAWREAGHPGEGAISVMLHTFVCGDDDEAKELARGPFCNYMASSYDLVKVAPWMFPAFKQPSSKNDGAFDAASFDAEDQAALLDHAFERYFETAGLFGTPERALKMVEQLKEIGATEIACLIDFGVEPQIVIDNFHYLNELRILSNPNSTEENLENYTVAEQIKRHGVTHLQCTPSMVRLLVADGALPAISGLKKLLLGGEALPLDLVEIIKSEFHGELWNMYGPTEATIWSTTSLVESSEKPVSIGRPIANTSIRILGADRRLAPIGEPGELCIGGAGVVRGYFGQIEMTKERFIDDPFSTGELLYRTGDLARYRNNGELEFMGRLDQQVKLNGYRIEMGEIEAILSKHPSVRESVVVAREDNGPAQLVAYMVTGQVSQDGDNKSDEGSHVASWGKLWSGAYQQGVGAQKDEPRFNTSGWLSSFTGEPIAQEHMRHWVTSTVDRIVALKPKSVLEIGCGTGMLLYAALPHVETYTGVDVSEQALQGIRAELSNEEKKKVNLFNCPAHELQLGDIKTVDLVVINSVAQYFPNAEYLERVLKSAASIVRDGGQIFLGDLRCLEGLRAFHTEIELHQAPSQSNAASMKTKIDERQRLESELLISQSFFADLPSRLPGMQLESIQLKRGTDDTEMTLHRYDVVLTVHSQPGANSESAANLQLPEPLLGISQTSELIQHLSHEPPLLLVQALPNARLRQVQLAMSAIDAGEGKADELRQMLQDVPSELHPESLFSLDDRYNVEMRWGSSALEIDVLFRHKQTAPSGSWALAPRTVGTATTNVPASGSVSESIVPSVRKHLRDFLPEYMIPTAYVVLPSLPLTPNGKIDRKSLPAPGKEKTVSAQVYVTPQNDLEKTIAGIWQEMLGIERVGIKDNIFDLGASSLLTVEANSRLSAALQKKIPLVNMFRYPTIESLAKHLGAALNNQAAPDNEQKSEQDDRKQAAIDRRRQARARATPSTN